MDEVGSGACDTQHAWTWHDRSETVRADDFTAHANNPSSRKLPAADALHNNTGAVEETIRAVRDRFYAVMVST